MQDCRRRPVLWIGLIVLVILLGVGSRRFGHALPAFVAAYAGDTLWATVAFLGIGLILPRARATRIAALALLFSLLIEVSQLYHVPWIDMLRRTTLGGLVLGFGFVWSDLACYAVGVALGAGIEWCVTQQRRCASMTMAQSRSSESSPCPERDRIEGHDGNRTN